MIRSMFALAGAAALWTTVSWGDETRPDAETLVATIRDNLDQLLSAEYAATGVYDCQARQTGERWRYEEFLEGAFDHASGRSLFRRIRRRTEGSQSFRDYFSETWFVSLPDMTILVTGRHGESSTFSVGLHRKMNPRDAGSTFKPIFDVRVLPFARYLQLEFPYEDFASVWEALKIVPSMEAGGLVEFMIRDGESSVDRWWCDPAQGNQFVRHVKETRSPFLDRLLEEQERKFPGFRDRIQNAGPVMMEATLAWTQSGDTWVPQSYHLVSEELDMRHDLALTFHWKSVNTEIDPARFDWKAWDFPEGSRVFDMRLGKDNSILLRRYGRPYELELTSRRGEGRSAWQAWLVLGNAAVLGSLFGWLLAGGMLCQRPTSPP